MENRQGTLVWVGALAIACLGYFYKQKRDERQEYIKSKNILKEKCREIIDNGKKIDFQKIKKSNKRQSVFFPQINHYELEDDTYKRFIRYKNNMDYEFRELGVIREGEIGGRFSFKDPINNQQIIAEINNCKIEEFVLSQKREHNIVFEKENMNKISESSNLTYKIKAGQNLALFGLIGYSITEQKFILEPEFIVSGSVDAQQIFQRLSSFWQQKIEQTAFQKVLLGFSILAVTYVFVYHPLKSIWNRHHNKFEGVSKDKIKHFIEKSQFQARTSSNLTCEICKVNSVAIVYDCGHLCSCQACNEKNKDQQCPICNKISAKSIKIYL